MRTFFGLMVLIVALLSPACLTSNDRTPQSAPAGRLVMFIGVDVSGSFLDGSYFEDSIKFLARYIHAHLHGTGGLEIPNALFVGSIGGVKKDEPKTLFPIQTFQDKSIEEVEARLREIFPKAKPNPFTDFNAFFAQVAETVSSRKLLLKPISIVLITDGKPDLGGKSKSAKFRALDLSPLEALSRNVTLRVLYTDAVTAKSWQDEVPRKRVKVWTQDAVVMTEWKKFSEEEKFLAWVRDNVDFSPRLHRVD